MEESPMDSGDDGTQDFSFCLVLCPSPDSPEVHCQSRALLARKVYVVGKINTSVGRMSLQLEVGVTNQGSWCRGWPIGHLSLPQYKNKDNPVVKHYIVKMNKRMKVNLCTILCLILDDVWSASYSGCLTHGKLPPGCTVKGFSGAQGIFFFFSLVLLL
jgi:hypothetical protein